MSNLESPDWTLLYVTSFSSPDWTALYVYVLLAEKRRAALLPRRCGLCYCLCPLRLV